MKFTRTGLSLVTLILALPLAAASYPRDGEVDAPRAERSSLSPVKAQAGDEQSSGLPRDAATLVRYFLGSGDFGQAETLALALKNEATTKAQVLEADELLAAITRQRELALRIALDAAERARMRSDWGSMRQETARALQADAANPSALALARWMEARGIVRAWVVSK